MTALDLMNCIGQVKGTYILEAKNMAVPRRKSARRGIRRGLLIAAIIALVLLLVGCTVVYVLRLQDLKVGEYRYQTNPVYDENGQLIPAPTHSLRTEISLQGANQEALIQWNEFAAQHADDPLDGRVPENYLHPYGCRSLEMVQKLNEILAQYNLSMLSPEVDCQTYEAGKVLFESLGIGGLVREDALSALEYLDGWFYPEGTFTQNLLFTLDSEQWPYENNYAQYHYSQKAYFEPRSALITDFENCTQWNYLCKSGQTVLLAMNEEQAWIFADRPDAFVSVSLWLDSAQAQMPREVLEQIAEAFDYSIAPHPADMAMVPALQAQAKSDDEARRAASRQSLYSGGYESYVQKQLDSAMTTAMRDGLCYSLYDLNGDGTPELLSGGKLTVTEILSLKDGESYRYFSAGDLCAIAYFTVCQENVLALKAYFTEDYYYLRPREESMTLIEGVRHQEGKWYHLTEPPVLQGQRRVENWVEITEEQARAIMESYVPLETQPERQQMKKYGQPVKVFHYTDPYALYIADSLERYEDAAHYTYALLDVNGDGIKELFTRNQLVKMSGESEPEYQMRVHTIVDGQLAEVGSDTFSVTDVCEGGILMVRESDGTFYEFYKIVGTEAMAIDKVWQDYVDLYWSRDPDGYGGPEAPRPITQEEAQAAISAYKPIELDMKPFSEYPFR